MNWSDLPVFLAVARSGQLARAATALKTDATTVGRRVRRLERELGERLFEQSPLGQTLTPAGIALLARVEKMAEIVGAIAPLSAAGEGVQGSIRVSVSEGFGSWFLARHIGDLLARHPGLEIDLVANSGFLNPSRRETDVAVLLARPRRGPLIVRKLTDYTLHLYAASTYLEQHDAIGDPTALDQHPLIGYISDILYAPELRYLEELPVAASPRLRSTSINAQHQMVASGNGLGILPRFIGSNDPTLVNILPELSIRRSFWLVTHRETHSFPPVTAFRNWLVSLVSEKRELLCAKGQ